MEVLALLIALLALVVAALAYIRTGGKEDLRKQIDDLGVKTESAREKTANALDHLERIVRGPKKEAGPGEGAGGEPGPTPPETGGSGGKRGGGKKGGGSGR